MGNVMRKGDKNSDWKHLILTKVCFHTRKCHKSKDKDKHMISLRLLTMIDEVQQLLAPTTQFTREPIHWDMSWNFTRIIPNRPRTTQPKNIPLQILFSHKKKRKEKKIGGTNPECKIFRWRSSAESSTWCVQNKINEKVNKATKLINQLNDAF